MKTPDDLQSSCKTSSIPGSLSPEQSKVLPLYCTNGQEKGTVSIINGHTLGSKILVWRTIHSTFKRMFHLVEKEL
jgi:hypothetical protein